jgi:hypothetical protein
METIYRKFHLKNDGKTSIIKAVYVRFVRLRGVPAA